MRSVLRFLFTGCLFFSVFVISAHAESTTQKIEKIRCTDHYWGIAVSFKDDRAIVEYRGEGWDDQATRNVKFKNTKLEDGMIVTFLDAKGGGFRFEADTADSGVGSFLDSKGDEEMVVGTCNLTKS